MTDDEPRWQPSSTHLEIPIEPLPTEPLVPRPAPPDPEPEPVREPEPAPESAVLPPENVAVPVETPEPERDEAGRGALRPTTPRPAPSQPSARPERRPAPASDRRHPVRATFGLIVLVIFGSLALAAAVGLAIAVIAFAVRQSVG